MSVCLGVCVWVGCRSLLKRFHEMGCQDGASGFKTMGDNDFNFVCSVCLTMRRASLKRNAIFVIASHYLVKKGLFFLCNLVSY